MGNYKTSSIMFYKRGSYVHEIKVLSSKKGKIDFLYSIKFHTYWNVLNKDELFEKKPNGCKFVKFRELKKLQELQSYMQKRKVDKIKRVARSKWIILINHMIYKDS